MKYQVIRAFSTSTNGKRTDYPMGMRIGEARYAKLPRRIQNEYFLPARAAASRTPYLRSEVEQLFALYLELDANLEAVRSAYLEANPDTRHTAESIRSAAGQIRSLDAHYPNDNNWVAKSLFREVAAAIDAERFGGAVTA